MGIQTSRMLLYTLTQAPKDGKKEKAKSRGSGQRTGKEQVQTSIIIDAFVGLKLEDVDSWDVAPEILVHAKELRLIGGHGEGRPTLFINPSGLPVFLCERRPAINLVNGPVGLLALSATVLRRTLGVSMISFAGSLNDECLAMGKGIW